MDGMTDLERHMKNVCDAFGHTVDEEKEILRSRLDGNGLVQGYPFYEPYDQKLRNYFVHRVLVHLYKTISKDWKYRDQIFRTPNYIIRGVEFKLTDITDFASRCDEYLTEETAEGVADNIREVIANTLIHCYEHPDDDKSKDMLRKFEEYDNGHYYDLGAYPTEVYFGDVIPKEKWEWE